MTDKSRECLYNTSKSANFVGYCDHPMYYDNTGHLLVKCKKCPCTEWKPREDEE